MNIKDSPTMTQSSASARLFGMKIVVSEVLPEFTPRMQLTAKCEAVLTPAFAAETNVWMAEFFGKQRTILISQLGPFGKTIFTHANTARMLINQTKEPT